MRAAAVFMLFFSVLFTHTPTSYAAPIGAPLIDVTNGGFEDSITPTGWTVVQNRTNLGVTSIAGCTTVDTTPYGVLHSPEAPLRCIDVGTGGGFPGLAVAIALPQAQLTLVDSVGRKTQAVQAMAEALGLQDRVELRCERIELTGRQKRCRGQFDLAMARAVAAAPVVAEYLVPLLAPGGEALLYRGQWNSGDQRDLEAAITPLKAAIGGLEQRDLPGGRGQRTAIVLRSQEPCPKTYPRAVGIPSKFPLAGGGD